MIIARIILERREADGTVREVHEITGRACAPIYWSGTHFALIDGDEALTGFQFIPSVRPAKCPT